MDAAATTLLDARKVLAMDANRFDDVARSLTAVLSRRTVFGFALAGLAGAGNLWGAEAKKGNNRKKKCKKCGPCKICKKGKCKANKPDGTACGEAGFACQGGRCTAEGGESCAEGRIRLTNGACALPCTASSACPAGCECPEVGITEERVCGVRPATCGEVPIACEDNTDCLSDHFCVIAAPCPGRRCVKLCPPA